MQPNRKSLCCKYINYAIIHPYTCSGLVQMSRYFVHLVSFIFSGMLLLYSLRYIIFLFYLSDLYMYRNIWSVAHCIIHKCMVMCLNVALYYYYYTMLSFICKRVYSILMDIKLMHYEVLVNSGRLSTYHVMSSSSPLRLPVTLEKQLMDW